MLTHDTPDVLLKAKMKTMYRTLAIVVALICVDSLLSAEKVQFDPSAPSWPRWRGPDGTGNVAETAWNPKSIESSKPLWKVSVGLGYSSVCVVGGYVYTAGTKDFKEELLVCLNGKSGAEVWSAKYPTAYVAYPGSRSTPVFENGRLYIMNMLGHAYCFDALTGKKLWDIDIAKKTGAQSPTWAFSSSALIEGNLLIFNICASGVALDKATGKIVWKSAPTASGYDTPVPFDFKGKRCLAVLGSRQFFVVEAATGKELAKTDWATAYDVNVGDPVVVGDTIFLGSNYGTGCALFRLTDGGLKKLWENKSVLSHFSSAVYQDGYYYCNSGFAGEGVGSFFCLDARNGKVMWENPLGVGSLLGVGKRLLLTTEKGDLIVAEADPKRFTMVAQAAKAIPRLCWTAPVMVGGRIYLRSDKGDLVCLDVSS
jgi:outer membrane protein assembly factor BamB